MAVTLQFDAEGCYRALIQELVKVSDSIIENFYNDAIAGLDMDGQADSERINAILDETREYVEAQCKFKANALMQSFGTGSNADMSADSYWKEYESSGLFNPARRSKGNAYISGRPAGTYTNIYGEKQDTSGRNAGKNIEYIHITDKNGQVIQLKPVAPKFSIQNAERWLIKNHQRRVEDKIEEAMVQFFAEEAKKFFVEISI